MTRAMVFWQQALLSLGVSLIPAGGLFMLLKVGPERRKIGADATLQEATAAATLTGSALQMVNHAEARAASAERKAERAERIANAATWRVHELTNWIRSQGLDLPAHLLVPIDAGHPQDGP